MERNLWKESEIRTLLGIIEERNILTMINEKKYRNEQIFRYVESEMCARGFTKKNFQQIWTKWKFLKSSYVTTKRHNSIPGNVPRTCDYYYLLDRILGEKKMMSPQPTISSVQGGIELPPVIKQEVMDDEIETSSLDVKNPESPEASSTPLLQPPEPVHERPQRRRRLRVNADIPEAYYPDLEQTEEPSIPKKPIQGNYLRALKELATNLRQMQRELVADFFRKQEELIREEHEFQRQQDEILLKSFEEQTRLLLDSARNLLASGVSVAPDVVYINED